MPENKRKIVKGLISDGMVTAYYSYQLMLEGKSNLALVYLTQANTFITAAKTLYYEYETLFPEKELNAIFYAFGTYNNRLLTSIRTEKENHSEVAKAYEGFLQEFSWLSTWLSSDLLKDLATNSD